MLVDALIDYLLAETDLVALVGGPYVFRTTIPQGFRLPAVVLRGFPGGSDHYQGGPSNCHGLRLEVSCWARDARLPAQLGKLVERALERITHGSTVGDVRLLWLASIGGTETFLGPQEGSAQGYYQYVMDFETDYRELDEA